MAYDNLFPSSRSLPTRNTADPDISTPKQEIPNFLPVPFATKEQSSVSTPIDTALAGKLGREALLRVKAMEMTIQLIASKTWSPEGIEELYKVIFNKIKNGATK